MNSSDTEKHVKVLQEWHEHAAMTRQSIPATGYDDRLIVKPMELHSFTSSNATAIENLTSNLKASISGLQPVYNDPFRKYYSRMNGIAYRICKDYSQNTFYHCLNCLEYVKSYSSICNHINKHRDVKPYRCFLCENNYTNRGSLRRHWRVKHFAKQFNKQHQPCQCCHCFKICNDILDFCKHVCEDHTIDPEDGLPMKVNIMLDI